ncbi:MAG TPA: antibiotic biosynthesis monooxygenase [Chthoniobacterales bacterium]|nr:antibiotic biosynthesis monooxygenase [Chthoniobacterales bacterium]
MAGVCVIVAYRPESGKNAELLDLVRSRVPTLRTEGLVSDRAPIITRAQDGTIVKVSAWKSAEAIDAAHGNSHVLAIWDKFYAARHFVLLKDLRGAAEMFAGLSRS